LHTPSQQNISPAGTKHGIEPLLDHHEPRSSFSANPSIIAMTGLPVEGFTYWHAQDMFQESVKNCPIQVVGIKMKIFCLKRVFNRRIYGDLPILRHAADRLSHAAGWRV
jgi:hypothetical protein